jgi:hypothetical protein
MAKRIERLEENAVGFHLCCTVKGCDYNTTLLTNVPIHELVHDPTGQKHTPFVVKECIFKEPCVE